MADIVILGAGLTGLSAAYHLEKKGFYNYKIFEKESEVGGLCRSVQQDGFTFDYTGHLLHINDDYFRSFIDTCIGFEHFNTITRQSFIYSEDTYTRYPYQINLYGLPPHVIAECIEKYVTRPRIRTTKNLSFQQWVLNSFGAGFGKHFFFPYQRKIFDYPVTKLSASWTGRFVPTTSLNQMLLGALQDNYKEVGYNAHFFYPKVGGIFFLINKLYSLLKNTAQTNHCVKTIDMVNQRIIFTNGAEEPYQQLITTLPLKTMLGLLKEPAHSNLAAAQTSLLCNSVINFNLGINRPDLSTKHWIYFPESKFPFYRLGFSHNFAASMAPTGCSSLYGEFSFLNKSPQKVAQLLKESLKETKKLLSLADHEIMTEKIISIDHAYVIYNHWRDNNVPKILKQLADHQIFSLGRYGAWKYASMQEGLLEGKQIADALIIMPAQHIKKSPTVLPKEHIYNEQTPTKRVVAE